MRYLAVHSVHSFMLQISNSCIGLESESRCPDDALSWNHRRKSNFNRVGATLHGYIDFDHMEEFQQSATQHIPYFPNAWR